MVGWPTTWGGKQAIGPPEIFKIMFLIVVGCNNKLHFAPQKIAAACGQSRRCGEVLLGLCPHKKLQAPQIEIWNSKYYKSWRFSFSQCQAPPHKRNAPLLKTFWRQFWMQPCCWVISTLFVWSQKMILTQQHISNWNVWFSCAHKPKILYVIKNKKILKKFQQLQ